MTCAVRELQEIGYEFKQEYLKNVLRAEAVSINQIHMRKGAKQDAESYNDWQDDRFYFIAGYTSGGAPYGVTWGEMELEPYENDLDDNEAIVCYRYYDFLNKREKDLIDSRLRENFSRYVGKYRRLLG